MTTADAKRADAAEGEGGLRASTPSDPVPPSSPVLSSAWLLRTGALALVAAGLAGVLVTPGLRGNASEAVVLNAERAASALAVVALGALVALTLWGSLELLRARGLPAASRAILVAGSIVVLTMALTGMHERVPRLIAFLLAACASACALVGATAAARGPHTRAIAGILIAFAFASIARLAAWQLAINAGDLASIQLFGWSRTLATAGVLLEAAGQLAAVTYLGARGRISGQLACSAALLAAFGVTLCVAFGARSGAPGWQAVLHASLADAPGIPSPYGVAGLATFLVPASLLLALVAALQPGQVVAVGAAMALSLASRGAFDAPLRSLCAVVAAEWAALACIDDRAMWRTLIQDRLRRLRERDGA